MQGRLIVKNFGPIKNLDLEIKPFTVLIGPQGSGKSTVAKILAVCKDLQNLFDYDFLFRFTPKKNLFEKYGIKNYIKSNSVIEFHNSAYSVYYSGNFEFEIKISEGVQDQIYYEAERLGAEIILRINPSNPTQKFRTSFEDIKAYVSRKKSEYKQFKSVNYAPNYQSALNFYKSFLLDRVFTHPIYIPSERNLISVLSSSLWSLINNNSNLPLNISTFGSIFESARNEIKELDIKELEGIKYKYLNGVDYIIHNRKRILLSESASGYQSSIPLFLCIEYLKRYNNVTFLIEEPELNLFPISQKRLVSYLAQVHKTHESRTRFKEILLTTHSPYVLSVINNLLFAGQASNFEGKSLERIQKVIPSTNWIYREEFAAFALQNGIAKSIVNPKTGLIFENELDNVSIEISEERSKLLDIYRKQKK